MVLKLPTPKRVEDKFYSIQGLFLDQEDSSWDTMWRLFKASLYHLSLHAAYSDFSRYANWAKGKHVPAATYAVSFVEDVYVTMQAKNRWPGLLPDIAFSNYVSSLRVPNPNRIVSDSTRFAAKLLLEVSGVHNPRRESLEEDTEVKAFGEEARKSIDDVMKSDPKDRATGLVQAAQEVYSLVSAKGSMREIPFLPYTESHGESNLFETKLLEGGGSEQTLAERAYSYLGQRNDIDVVDAMWKRESRDALVDVQNSDAKLAKIRAFYEDLIQGTNLQSVEFPMGDIAAFMRVRSDLAGPIKNVRDQLSLVRNVLDDVSGHESGSTLDTQAVMQMMASRTQRTDLFEQLMPMHKEEAWVMLIDASKSVGGFAHEIRGIATCLAEVGKSLMPDPKQWAMYAFNNVFQIIKDFEENYTIVTKARIGGLTQRNTTLLPDALTAAYKTLAAKPESAKILCVVSDGYPSGYADIEKKLEEAIKEVKRSGVLLMGVGVDSSAIQDYFDVNCVLSTPYEMMKFFSKSYYELSYSF